MRVIVVVGVSVLELDRLAPKVTEGVTVRLVVRDCVEEAVMLLD